MRPVSSQTRAACSRDTDPMTNRQPTTQRGWWRLALAAIAAALAVLLGAGTASATTAPVLETRVGASTPATAYTVGVHESVSAGQRWGNAPPQAETVVGRGVAAKAVPNEGIYVIRNAADEVYVGQSGNITSRLGQHVSTGKFTQAEVDAAERFEVLGGKTAREIQEQLKLDSFGGRDASGVLNKVNPIGDRRLSLMPPGYVRP